MVVVLLKPLIQLVVVYGQIHDPLPVILIHGYRQSEASWYGNLSINIFSW